MPVGFPAAAPSSTPGFGSLVNRAEANLANHGLLRGGIDAIVTTEGTVYIAHVIAACPLFDSLVVVRAKVTRKTS